MPLLYRQLLLAGASIEAYETHPLYSSDGRTYLGKIHTVTFCGGIVVQGIDKRESGGGIETNTGSFIK